MSARASVATLGNRSMKRFEVRNHRCDLRLLQHHLRDPHAIRGARMLPRQILAAVSIEPREHLVGEGSWQRSCVRATSAAVTACRSSEHIEQRARGIAILFGDFFVDRAVETFLHFRILPDNASRDELSRGFLVGAALGLARSNLCNGSAAQSRQEVFRRRSSDTSSRR